MRESDLLHYIYQFNAELPAGVTIPPGDDMGALQLHPGNVLVAVDQVVDGVHVQLSNTPIEKVGRKAITRNLSDIAAMAAKPSGAVVAACLPRSFGEANAKALFNAMRATGAAYDCPLVGGDISIWDHPMVLSVTVFAECPMNPPITRCGAKPCDVIIVTGELGGSLEPVGDPPSFHHLDFEPRINIAAVLAGDTRTRPRCMIDLSDGLATDLARIVRASEHEVSACINVAQLPVSAAAAQAASRTGRPRWQHALTDGEDYELCIIAAPHVAANLPREIDGVPITRIGHIIPRAEHDVMLNMPDNTTRPCNMTGWEHQD